uniref:Uncharacterized protein n=1 Tax=Anopheles coluzzii TaxID=1518534 RepID=A0A8W7Q386_ANOCL
MLARPGRFSSLSARFDRLDVEIESKIDDAVLSRARARPTSPDGDRFLQSFRYVQLDRVQRQLHQRLLQGLAIDPSFSLLQFGNLLAKHAFTGAAGCGTDHRKRQFDRDECKQVAWQGWGPRPDVPSRWLGTFLGEASRPV